MLFKIQSYTTELLTIGQELRKDLLTFTNKKESIESLQERNKLIPEVAKGVLTKNVTYLHEALKANHEYQATSFLEIRSRFDRVYALYSELVDRTIKSAILTGIVIVFCLSMIPLGEWIYSKPILLYTVFSVTVLAVIIIFYKFITILKNALK